MTKKTQPTVQEEQMTATVSTLEVFFKKNLKIFESVIIAILVIICAGLALNKWYLIPAKEEAKAQMFNAEQLFRAGNYETALNGDGNNLGFADIASQYGRKAGKIVYFYEGCCNLHLGNNEDAINCFNKFKTSDDILAARALCCTGDAYANLGETAKALSYFKKAAAKGDNQFAAGYLLKAGIASEELGDQEGALKFYKEIELKYPQSIEGYDIQKYISRIENK